MISSIYQILSGSLLLSAIHAGTPNHWLPLVVLGKTEKWSRRRMLQMTAIAGLAPTTSAIILGVATGWFSQEFYTHDTAIMKIIGSLMLIALGFFYWVIALARRRRQLVDHRSARRSMTASPMRFKSIVEEMFFSPCLPIVVYSFTAGFVGWHGIVAVLVIHFAVTMAGMMTFVDLNWRGVEKFQLRVLEHYEKAITGALLVVFGILAYMEL